MFSTGIGSKTSTGGEVVEGNNGIMMNPAASSLSATSNSSSAAGVTVPKINPNNMYHPLAPEGEKYIEVEYLNPITSIAVLSLDEAQELYQNLGGKESIGNVRNYSELAKGGSGGLCHGKRLR